MLVTVITVILKRKEKQENEMELIVNIALLCLGFVMLIKGADVFVEGAASLAKKFGVPQLVIGLTVVAMGTSLPEAAVSITSAMNGSAGIAIGNVLGSNIMNILVILGITSVITKVAIQKSTFQYEIPFMIFVTVVLVVFGMRDGIISRIEGVILWILFLGFLFYLFKLSKVDTGETESVVKDLTIVKCILYIVIGASVIVLGSNFAVQGASTIARFFGISERIIGLTIVAFGTSLPELVTSVTAARKGNTAIAIGNIVGSNLFNILFVIGSTALILNVPFEPKFLVDSMVAIFAAILLWLCTFKDKELGRTSGIIMLTTYLGYFIYLCLM